MPNRVGLKDIAKALNVSVTTVSRALNNKFDISKDTRDKILKKAEELNYRPNAHAISLRKNEYYAIGVILPSIDHYFFSTVLKGIMNKAHMANYLVIIGESSHDLVKEQEIIEKFIAHCVSGVIISPSNKSSYGNNLALLKSKRIPYILVDRPLEDSKNERIVRFDDEYGAFLAVDHLIKQGYRKIAMIKGFDYCTISNARFKGYKKALENNGLSLNPDFVKHCGFIDESGEGYHLSKQMLTSMNRPDAFFTVTDEIASGIYQTVNELGMKIPNEVGIVGYSNSKISSVISPRLTSVEQPGMLMGEQAFDFLQQTIIDNSSTLERTFEARLVVRASSLRNHIQTSTVTKENNYGVSV